MRWWLGPHEIGTGREWCEEWCRETCAAISDETCCAKPVEPLPANAFAWQCFKDSLWQFTGSGCGDATLNAPYVQSMMADRGLTGPDRDEEMQRVRVLVEELQEMQKIRSKRKRQPE